MREFFTSRKFFNFSLILLYGVAFFMSIAVYRGRPLAFFSYIGAITLVGGLLVGTFDYNIAHHIINRMVKNDFSDLQPSAGLVLWFKLAGMILVLISFIFCMLIPYFSI